MSLPGSANPVMKVSHWHARRLLSEGIPGPVTVAINMKTSQTMGSIDRQRDQYIGVQADRQTNRERQTDRHQSQMEGLRAPRSIMISSMVLYLLGVWERVLSPTQQKQHPAHKASWEIKMLKFPQRGRIIRREREQVFPIPMERLHRCGGASL